MELEGLPAISNGYIWSVSPKSRNYAQIRGNLPENLENTLNIFVRGDWILDYEIKTDATLIDYNIDINKAEIDYMLDKKIYHRKIVYDGNKILDITDLPDADYIVMPRGKTVFHHRDWYRMPDTEPVQFKKQGNRYYKTGLDGIDRCFEYNIRINSNKKILEITVNDDYPDKDYIDPHEWIKKLDKAGTSDPQYNSAFEKAKNSIAQLMIYVKDRKGDFVRAQVAGYPVFPSVFGRDSDITDMGLIYIAPELVKENIEFRLSHLGKKDDIFRSEKKGKAFHEYNIDELTNAGIMEGFPNYIGTDESGLLGMSVGRYTRITKDYSILRNYKNELRSLWNFIETSVDKNGFLSFKGDIKDRDGRAIYFTRNHTWRDSDNGILHPDGQYPAQKLTVLWDQLSLYAMYEEFERLVNEAEGRQLLSEITGISFSEIENEIKYRKNRLKKSINDRFWMDDLDAYAISLDRDGNQVKTVNSDVCLGLYYKVFDADKAKTLIENTVSNPDRLKDKFGIRSISKEHPVYSPDGYHLGGIWPFQTAIMAIGVESYGYRELGKELREANINIIKELGDLPELIKSDEAVPTRRDGSSEPQAWSAAAIFLSHYENPEQDFIA